jgi:hypothetical protein
MPIYTVSATTTAATTGSAYCTFHTVASRRAYIREIRIFNTAATASPVGLIRPNNTPVASTSVVPVAYDVNDAASTALMDTAWSTAPTIGSNVFLRKSNLANVQGAYDVWTFPQVNGLPLAVSSFYVLWNYGGSTASALDVTFIYEE